MKNNTITRKNGAYGDLAIDTSIPVLILGGKENSLSLCRSFGRTGITVRVSGKADCWGLYSRYCQQRFSVAREKQLADAWGELLLGEQPTVQQKHVILPGCDNALEFLATHEAVLRKRHLFDPASASQKLALLDKQQTLKMASRAGVAAPQFWPVSRGATRPQNFDGAQFPLLVKPLNTFKFAQVFGCKFFTVTTNFEDLEAKVKIAHEAGFDVSVVEQIPGPDDLLSSYYTYIDETGQPLFHFTKRIVRRYPVNSGGATYHVSDWLPETAQEGLKFFQNTGFQGFGNIEFKKDPRDGVLKVIEVNARFTAAQELAIRTGAPLDLIVYCALTGQQAPTFTTYESNLYYWYPLRDFLSFMQLRRLNQLSVSGWLKSLSGHSNISPVFDRDDLKPSIGSAGSLVNKAIWGRL